MNGSPSPRDAASGAPRTGNKKCVGTLTAGLELQKRWTPVGLRPMTARIRERVVA